MIKRYGAILLVVLIGVFQLLTTNVHLAWMPTDSQRQQIITRPGLYPIGGYRLEAGAVAITYDNWRKNVWENINVNQYFFGGHPVERDIDFPKFPFWLLPLATIGIWHGVRQKWFVRMSICTLACVVILGFVGNNNPYGNMVAYPFWIISIIWGIKNVVKK